MYMYVCVFSVKLVWCCHMSDLTIIFKLVLLATCMLLLASVISGSQSPVLHKNLLLLMTVSEKIKIHRVNIGFVVAAVFINLLLRILTSCIDAFQFVFSGIAF